MEIQRINSYNDPRFSPKVLQQHGAFLADNEPYEVEIISDRAAVVRGRNPALYERVIDEFRFYAEHITRFADADGHELKRFEDIILFPVPLHEIQPSQFYVDARKKEAVSTFIHGESDVIIPLIRCGNGYASLDGHTRMAVAVEKGIPSILGFLTQAGDYLQYFIEEAQRRGIHTPYDLKELSHEEYEIQWNQFCDEYFKTFH